jgi:hypothetical protein
MPKNVVPRTINKHAPTIKDRLEVANRKLKILIGLFAVEKSYRRSDVFDDEMVYAVFKELEDAHTALYWVSRLPDLVTNLPAPDDEEIDGYNGGDADVDAVLETHFRARISQPVEGAR